MKSYINTFSHDFKIPTHIALGLIMDQIYSLNNAHAWQPLAWYIQVIMHYRIDYNIIDIANQLSFIN